MNKLVGKTLLALSSALVFAQAPLAQTIKLGTIAPEGSPWHVAMRDMAEAWKQLSHGQIRVQIYAGTAGNEPDMVRKMRTGLLHGAALTGQDGLAQIAGEMRVFETPMLIKSEPELDFVREKLDAYMRQLLQDKGFRVLGWSDIGWVYLFTNRAVTSPDDARALRIRVGPSDTTWIKLLKDRGYQPVPLPVTEIHTGLQSGLIDGFAAPPVMALASQWFGSARHMTDLKWAPLTGALVLTEKTWQKIDPDLRPSLQAAARQAAKSAQVEIRRFETGAIDAMRQYGLTVHPLSEATARSWEQEVYDAYPTIVGSSVPEDVFNMVKRARDLYRRDRVASSP